MLYLIPSVENNYINEIILIFISKEFNKGKVDGLNFIIK